MKPCKIIGCDRKHEAKGYCKWHYEQERRHGKVATGRFEPNEITIEDNVARIALYNNRLEVIAETIIDIEDIPKVKDTRWALIVGYAGTRTDNRSTLFLHNVILNREPNRNIMPDHKNRNRLDNRKSNLRLCNNAQNIWNAGERSDNTSGKKGVCWHKTYGKWVARLEVHKTVLFLGCFLRFSDAVKARCDAELKYYGEYIPQEVVPWQL